MRRVGVGTRKIKHDLEPYMKNTGVIRSGKTAGVGDDDKHTIEKLLERSLGVGEEALPIDLEFDDRDFPRAKNFVEFLSSPKFMNTDGWARQYEMGTKLYAEFCPKCTDMKWFGPVNDGYLHVPVDADLDEFKAKVQLLNLGRCPKCKRSKSDNYRDKLVPQFSELAGCAGQRSAKSMGLAMVATYLNHQLIKLQKPTAVYGVLPSTTLYGTFVALTYAQAKESLFDPFSLLIADSPWFKKYHKFLDEQAKERGLRTPLYKFRDQFLVYRHRNLVWHASGPNKRVLRGRTRILGGLDEIGWFDADAARTKVKTSATEVYASMDNSLATIRAAANRLIKRGYNTVPTAILGNISSPSSRGDKIMQLHRESIGSNVTFGFHHPTWEMNPTMPLDCDYLQDKKRRSPLEFERDFAANPPLSSSPFFESSKVIMDTCRGSNMMSLSHKVRSRSDGTRSIYATPDKVVEQGQPCIMSIDAGETFNSFALTLIRSGGQMRDVPTDDGPQHKLQCVMMAEVVPKPDAPINHSLLYEHLIKPIIKKFNVKLLVADRWQSTKMLQDAELECEIATCRYSLKLEDMLYTKEQMEAGNVKICKPEIPIQEIKDYRADEYPVFFKDKPIAHFILQMLTIQRLGNQVVKGAGLTDDLWRCFALGTAFGFDPDYNSIFAGATVATTARNGSVFVGRSGSQGGGGGSSRSGVSVAFTRSAR